MSTTNHWQPFYGLNNFEFDCFIQSNSINQKNFSIDFLDNIIFNQFNANYDRYNPDLNPDLNFSLFSDRVSENCRYYFNDTIKNSVIKDNIDSTIDNNFFSLLSLNINSIPKNLEYFVNTCLNCLDFEFDIISFCETKLNNDIDQLYTIKNYNKYTNNNTRNSGGVAIFVKKCYTNVLRRNDLERNLFCMESLFIEIKCNNNKNILIGSFYRRPSSNLNEFLNELENIFDLIRNENKKIYLLGDFNINLFKFETDLQVKRFVNLMHGNNL